MSSQYLKFSLATIVIAISLSHVSSTKEELGCSFKALNAVLNAEAIISSQQLLHQLWQTKGEIWCRIAYHSSAVQSQGLYNACKIDYIEQDLTLPSLRCAKLDGSDEDLFIIPLPNKLYTFTLNNDGTLFYDEEITVDESVANAQWSDEQPITRKRKRED